MSVQIWETIRSYSPSRVIMLDTGILKNMWEKSNQEISDSQINATKSVCKCLQQWQPTSNVITVKIIPEAVEQQVISAFRSYFHTALTEEYHQGTHMTYSLPSPQILEIRRNSYLRSIPMHPKYFLTSFGHEEIIKVH